MIDKAPVLLIVDDRPDNLFVIEQLVNEYIPSCIILKATNADIAFQMANENQPDGILSDIQMPGKNGIELCRQIKQNSQTSDIPVLLITSHKSDPNSRIQGLEAGADDFISRPIDNLELAARIKVMFRIKYIQDELNETKSDLEKKIVQRTDELLAANKSLREEVNEHKQTEKELRESENFTLRILEAAGEGIYGLDTNGLTTFCNQATLKMLGYKFNELKGKTQHELIHHTRQDGTAYPKEECHIYATISDGKVHTVTNEIFWRKDGTSFPVEYQSSPVWEKEEIVGAVVVFRDVTETRRIEEQLQVRQRMDSLGALVGGIAHDFNNILAALKGNIDLLSMQSDNLNQKQNRYLVNAKMSTNRAVELVSQFQTLSNVSHYNKKIIDIYDIAEEVFALLEETTNRLIRKEIKFNKGEFFVSANPGELHQVLLNLATNSSHAIEEQEVTKNDYIRVTAENYQMLDEDRFGLIEGNYVHLSFKDTGCGMSTEVMKKAFNPMFTTKDKSSKRGQGLGLAMVYNIVSRHNEGFIEISSKQNKGSTFHIYLPKVNPEIQTDYEKTVATLGGTETILIVDDDEMVASLTESILLDFGYTLLIANDGMEAMDIYKTNQSAISVVILDLNMPKMSGKQVFEEMLKINPEVKVIISSGYSDSYSRQGILSVAKGHLSKPYDLEALSSTVRNVLDS